MNISRLERQIEFIKEIDKLKHIFRRNYLSDGSRRENDAEHSWHIALIVMILAEYFEDINLLKTLKMVLIHDLIEIYAGDTFAYDEQGNLDKAEREKAAAVKLFAMLPGDQEAEFTNLWEEFEEASSREAVFASVVDRLEPILLNICTEGRMWKEHGVTADRVMNHNKIVFESGPELLAEYLRRQIKDAVNKNYFSDIKKE